MNFPADIWAKVLSLMETEGDMTATTINTWFDDAVPVALEANRFILHTPTNFKRDIIVSRYLPAIQKALHELFSADFEVVVLGEGELEDFGEKKTDELFLPGTEEYTFERFVVGSSNKFAHAAALAVAEHPAQTYNPLFIYGESGLGKTHLLYAIAHKIHQNHPEYRIVYIKGDSFTNELIQAIREGRNPEFREKYRSADVFLMDDVQFIAGRESTQEEMFHTFNTLYEAGRQIVFTADRPPKEMLRLDDRLRTRFEWGLPVDIQPPDYETRVAIIKNKAIRRGMNLPDPVLQYIAAGLPGADGGERGRGHRHPGGAGHVQGQGRLPPLAGDHHRRGGQVLRHRPRRHPGAGPHQGHRPGPADRHVPDPAHDQPVPEGDRQGV